MDNPSNDKINSCPLCSEPILFVHSDKHRRYYHCKQCDLISTDPDCHPDENLEKSRYLLHENERTDIGYVSFLQPILSLVRSRETLENIGLDYGSGPNPILSNLLTEGGYVMRQWDPFFAPEQSVLDHTYDFIVCNETAEHFHHPQFEFDQIFSMLKPNGTLYLGTAFHQGVEHFKTWHYKNDLTHVIFFSEATMEWLARFYSLSLQTTEKRIAIFTN